MFRIILTFISAAIILCAPPSNTYAEDAVQFPVADFSALKQTVTAEVLEVITPNTIKLSNGYIVRLAGLHYPDYTPDRPGPFALAALKILKDMIEGQKVTFYQTKDSKKGRTNRMGHQIGHLKRNSDDAWVQGTVLFLGLAAVKTSQWNPQLAEQMYKIENFAREEKNGLWEDGELILSPATAPDHLNSFQIVEGRIESAALKNNRLYLNFGDNWRTDFTVSIPPEDKRLFSKAGLNPLEWNGKTIRARGWIEDFNGAYIEVNHPQAIEILTP